MKKKVLTVLVALVLGKVSLFAQLINLTVGIEDTTPVGAGFPKMPPRIPVVEQDGDQLSFESNHAEFTLELIQDDEVVYSVVVPSTTPNTYDKKIGENVLSKKFIVNK